MMKKIAYLFLILFSVCCFSCDDFLDTEAPSNTDSGTAYTSPSYTEPVIMGIYSMIADAGMYGQRISLNWSTNSDIEYVGADEVSYKENSNRGSSNYLGASDNTVFDWKKIYSLIERANLCIEGIKGSGTLNSSDKTIKSKMNGLLGEALAMRAIAYYELVKHWGDVPFKLGPTKEDLSNVYLPATDRDTVYTAIIKDLEEAISRLPWMGEGPYYMTPERISQGFARGMLARVCLSRAGYSIRNKPGFPTEQGSNPEYYYEIANRQCDTIIQQNLHKLNPSYLEVWKKVNALQLETTYKENLYEVALGLGQSGEMGYSIGVRFYKNAKYGYNNNTNVVNTSVYYFYSFDKEDSRRDITIANYVYSNGAGDLKEIFQSNPLSYNIGKWDQRWMSDAWRAINLGANGKIGYGINWIVMRYSDVLLMFAETENELNGAPTEKAKNALKEIRRRNFPQAAWADKVEKYVDDLNSKETFFDAIVNERAWEFGGEAIRKFDLIRWNKLGSKIQEQRDAVKNMLEANFPVTIFGHTYDHLPLNLYYKYQSDNENLDKADINYYESRTDLEPLSTAELTALGYTKVSWLSGAKDTDKTNWLNRINLFSSGLDNNSAGVKNRHLYPYSSTAVKDSQGKLSNSYGFN